MMTRTEFGVSLVLLLLAAPAAACVIGDPSSPASIAIVTSPPDCCYGLPAGTVAGTVNNVDSDSAVVVLYALTNQYYVQPSTQNPLTPIICPDGSFSNQSYGGCRYCALLVRNSWTPPAILFELPPVGGQILASATSVNSTPVPPLVFAGREWTVKTSCGTLVGPGFSRFSDSSDNVHVDAKGRLHLRITQRSGNWYCAEILGDEYLGYGVYEFEVQSGIDNLDPNVVFAGFSYSDQYPTDHDEIDIEFSRWAVPGGLNSQYVVQPYETCLREQFNTQLTDSTSSWEFIWMPESVTFTGWQDGIDEPGTIIHSYTYADTSCIPASAVARMRFNLWLYDADDDGVGDPPTDGQEVEVIVSDFRFYDWPAEVAGPGDRPAGPRLMRPVPNPATGIVFCSVEVPQEAHVSVAVFDSNGRRVAGLFDGDLGAGPHALRWTPRDASGQPLPGGIYYVRLRAGDVRQVQKLVLVGP